MLGDRNGSEPSGEDGLPGRNHVVLAWKKGSFGEYAWSKVPNRVSGGQRLNGRPAMSILREFLLLLAVMTAASMPVLAQTLSATGKAGSATSGGTAVPNLTGVWTHPSFPW